MKIALISDIHGNGVAFDAVLSALESVDLDGAVCLGDVVQGGAQPKQTLARLRKLDYPTILGNADDLVLTGAAGSEPVTEEQQAVRAWTLAQLSEADLAFMDSFRPTVDVHLGGGRRLLCFHGSPRSYDEVILPETSQDELVAMLPPDTPAFLAGGHTHLQQIRRVGASLFINPGTVGLSLDRHSQGDDIRTDPWAAYAVLTVEPEKSGVEFFRIAYDRAQYANAVLVSGHPAGERLAAWFIS